MGAKLTVVRTNWHSTVKKKSTTHLQVCIWWQHSNIYRTIGIQWVVLSISCLLSLFPKTFCCTQEWVSLGAQIIISILPRCKIRFMAAMLTGRNARQCATEVVLHSVIV